MNLGGIKVSSAELEQALSGLEGISDTAAIAINPSDGGPSRLVIYVAPAGRTIESEQQLQARLQEAIRSRLNPLFKIGAVRIVESLPRTASNKLMRRSLRAMYLSGVNHQKVQK